MKPHPDCHDQVVPQGLMADRRKAAALCLLAVAAVGILFAWDPLSVRVYPPCPFHAVTGLHCPGCGTLRALHQLLHGQVYAAFRFNPLMVASLPFLAYPLLSGGVYLLCGRHLPRVFVPARWIWLLLGVVVTYWILRNIPAYPFCLLAPTPPGPF